jgi:hypothetical protein
MPGANLSVQIHQGLNEPPTLEAVQKTTGRAVQLWNPNPQFLGMRWGEASVLRWKDESGDEWQGGLIKPVDYIPGNVERYRSAFHNYASGIGGTNAVGLMRLLHLESWIVSSRSNGYVAMS